jgi:hypothetical protein
MISTYGICRNSDNWTTDSLLIRTRTSMTGEQNTGLQFGTHRLILLTPFGTARRSESYIDKDKVNNIFASALILFV